MAVPTTIPKFWTEEPCWKKGVVKVSEACFVKEAIDSADTPKAINIFPNHIPKGVDTPQPLFVTPISNVNSKLSTMAPSFKVQGLTKTLS